MGLKIVARTMLVKSESIFFLRGPRFPQFALRKRRVARRPRLALNPRVHRLPLCLLTTFAAACGTSESLPDAGPSAPDATAVVLDATVVDAAPRYDGGVEEMPDVGFGDPATLHEALTPLGNNVPTYIRLRGTLTSTMPPVVVVNTGPLVGHEYLVEPFDFLLGPGGAADPDRLIVFFDMRATGRSGFGSIESSTITIDAHVEDFGYLLDWVEDFTEDERPVDIIGHGYGALVATLFAELAPARVGRLVLVAPYASHIGEQAEWGAAVNDRLTTGDRERLAQISEWNYCLRDLQRCSRDAWNIVGPTWFCEENRELFYRMTFQYMDARAYLFFISYDLRERMFDFRPNMTRVANPATVISGPCDPTPASTALNFAEHLPNATHYVLGGTGHFPMTEDPAAFQRIVRRALTY